MPCRNGLQKRAVILTGTRETLNPRIPVNLLAPPAFRTPGKHPDPGKPYLLSGILAHIIQETIATPNHRRTPGSAKDPCPCRVNRSSSVIDISVAANGG
jgi:hypothetical protein